MTQEYETPDGALGIVMWAAKEWAAVSGYGKTLDNWTMQSLKTLEACIPVPRAELADLRARAVEARMAHPMTTPRPDTIPLSLQVKLGSIAVHADEYLSPGGHPFDKTALEQLLKDQEVQEWIKKMGAFLPVKR